MSSRTDSAVRRVLADVSSTLSEAGFRQHRRCFNRMTEPGLVQAIEFEAGRHLPPGAGWGEYGRFTIELGVWIEELCQPWWQPKDGAMEATDCHLRLRIGELLPERTELWWEMFESQTAGADALTALANHGLPFLDRVRTRQAILDLHDGGTGVGSPPLSPLEVARLRSRRGEEEVARRLIVDYLAEDLTLQHRRYVLDELLPAWQLDHLVPPPDPSRWPRRSTVEFIGDAYGHEGAPVGAAGVVVDVQPEGYMVQLIADDGWGPLVGPVPQEDLALRGVHTPDAR